MEPITYLMAVVWLGSFMGAGWSFPAYIDPGTGSFLIQLLVGSVLGFLFFLKMQWRKIKARVTGLVGAGSKQE